jgi:hypothetical protein
VEEKKRDQRGIEKMIDFYEKYIKEKEGSLDEFAQWYQRQVKLMKIKATLKDEDDDWDLDKDEDLATLLDSE